MNREEVMQALSILKAAFPHSFQKMTRADAESMITLWERQFADEDPQAVGAAVDNLIATRTTGFSPAIGEIKEQLHRLRTVDEMNDSQAWTLVEKACQRGLYNAKEEFEKLPPDVQTAVGGPEQLKAWAMMDSETVNSVVASNFRKTYRTVQMREKEKAMMPPAVKDFLAGVAEQMKIGGGAETNKALTAHKEEPAMLPPRLEPLTAMPRPEAQAQKEQPEYKPMDEAEWERRRAEMLKRLEEAQTGDEK